MSRAHLGWSATVATFGTLAAALGQEAAAPAANDRRSATAAPCLWATSPSGGATVASTEADGDLPWR
jgi:hypothetical protein